MNNKLILPGNLVYSNHVEKQVKEIERNGNYRPLISKINEYLDFISKTPTDLMGAKRKGWDIKILHTNKKKGYSDISIRVNIKDRVTYRVHEDGTVTVLGILGHYSKTDYASYKPLGYDSLFGVSTSFFEGETSFEDMIEQLHKEVEVIPHISEENKEKLEKLKEKIVTNTLTNNDVDYLEFISNNGNLYFYKLDLLELHDSFHESQLTKDIYNTGNYKK